MIAQLKVLANAKEIELSQNEFKKIDSQNQTIEKNNKELSKAKRIDFLEYPIIPEPIYKNNDLLIDCKNVSLAFVNSNGEISIKYLEDNFNLVYSDEIWDKLKLRFDETKNNLEKRQLS
jgi:hypothetical protein